MQPTSTSRKYDRRKDEELGRSKVGRVTSKSGGIRGTSCFKTVKERKTRGKRMNGIGTSQGGQCSLFGHLGNWTLLSPLTTGNRQDRQAKTWQ